MQNSRQFFDRVQLSFWNLTVTLLSESSLIQTLYKRSFIFLRWYLTRSIIIQSFIFIVISLGMGLVFGFLVGSIF